MVDFRGRRFGADLTDKRIRMVGRTSSGDHPLIDLIEETPLNHFEPDYTAESGELVFSVPENRALLKGVRVSEDKGLDPEKLALFEFTSSLLDDPSGYFFETHHLNGDHSRLVVGYKRSLIEDTIVFFEKIFSRPSGFKLRGWALAEGYRNFCWKEGGELIALVDISDDITSFCLLRDNVPIRFGHVKGTLYDHENDKLLSNSYLSDLSTSLKYNCTMVSASGENLSLSQILITGSSTSSTIASLMEDYLKTRVSVPAVKKALFSPETAPLAPKYLISLGLTVV